MNKLFFALLAAVLASCEPNQTSNGHVSDEVPVAVEPAKVSPGYFYAGRPTEYTWPVAAETSQLSGSLLTPNYYLVIDGSGSMDEIGCSGNRRKIDVAKEAVNIFVDSIPQDANVGLLVFDHLGISERVPLGANHAFVKQKVQTILASGGTPLLDAMRLAYGSITKKAQEQLGYGEYHMVVVTDGEANGGQDPSELVDTVLRESPVTLHTIGFCIGDGHSLNIPGRIDYRAANNPAELLAGLRSVLAESNEYTADKFEQGGTNP